MSNTCKNYKTDGGDTLVIGGNLQIEAGASVTGIAVASLIDNLTSTATDKALTAKQGKVLKDAADLKIAANQAANATAAATTLETAEALANALQTDFNALLANLKAAGIMAADA